MITIDNLMNFYASCLKLGFVRLLCDEKSNGAVMIYAPNRKAQVQTFPYILGEEEPFYLRIKSTCYISPKLSKKNYEKMNKLKLKYKNRLTCTYETIIDEKKDKLTILIKDYIDENQKKTKVIDKCKMKMFTINYTLTEKEKKQKQKKK